MYTHAVLLSSEEASDGVSVVDTLKSCTAACVAVAQRLATVDFARSLRVPRRAGAEFGLLLLGERRGMVPEGFNHSSSPVQPRQLGLAGKAALMVSENAPHAVGFHAGARHVLLGSLHNAAAVAARAAELAQTSITVTCSGFRDEEDLDDSITAAYITAQLQQQLPDAASAG